DRRHNDGGAPQIERMSRLPSQMGVGRLDGGIEAIVAVDHANDDIEAVGRANARQVDAETNLETTRRDRRKRAHFRKVDHLQRIACRNDGSVSRLSYALAVSCGLADRRERTRHGIAISIPLLRSVGLFLRLWAGVPLPAARCAFGWQ